VASHSALAPGASPGCRTRHTLIPPTAQMQPEAAIAKRASSPAGAAGPMASTLQVGAACAYPPIDSNEAADPNHHERRDGD